MKSRIKTLQSEDLECDKIIKWIESDGTQPHRKDDDTKKTSQIAKKCKLDEEGILY